MDIKSMNYYRAIGNGKFPYLKLINQRELLDYKVEETYLLAKDSTIGRQDKNTIVIKDPYISGLHAQIIIKEGSYYIKDLGSKNGTFVNDKLLKGGHECRLTNGDKIRIGQVEFLFVDVIARK